MGDTGEVIREGTWRCPGCGNRNRGRDVKCGGCGQAREGVEFEYDESAPEVTGADLAIATGGADWICGYCSTSNRAASRACGQCGAAADEGARRAVSDHRPARASFAAAREEPSRTPPPLALFGFAILGFFALMFFMLRTHDEKLTLASASWSRTIAIEKLGPVIEEGWDVPAGGRVLSSSRQIHHYDKVPNGTRTVAKSYTERVQRGTKRVKTGTKNLGNGYFKDTYENRPVYETVSKTRYVTETVYRDVPVYRTRYRYEIEKWSRVRDVSTSGADTSPHWGPVSLGAREREGPRTSTCSVRLTGGGKEYTLSPPESQFTRLKVGQQYTCEINGFGTLQKLLD